MYDFTYAKPETIEAAAALLAEDPEAKALAGGQTYIPTLKQRLAMPSRLVDLGGIAGLDAIEAADGGLKIGAMARHKAVAESETVKRAFPELAYLASLIGDPAVRALGTIGGSIANNDPAADYPVVAHALDATIHTTKGEHQGADFFKGLFETALADDELITAVTVPAPQAAAWEKFRNPASRYALVSVLVAKLHDGTVRVGVGGAGSGPFRVAEMEEALAQSFTPEAINDVKVDPAPLNDDLHASAPYRAHLVTTMAKRAVGRLGD